MHFSEIFIRRPVLTWMFSLSFILFGLICLQRLPVREIPDVDPPIINVRTTYPGANARVVETEITEKLEEAIVSVQGIKRLISESREQASSITVEFQLDRDIEVAAQDVRDRVARVRGRLPAEVDEPIVSKEEGDANPILWVALYSDRHSAQELTEMVENILKDRLQIVPGVSSIIIGGQKRYAVRIWLDSEKMAARGITVLDVRRALQSQNLDLPSGMVENWEREMTILTRGQFQNAAEFNQLVLREEEGALIRLADIGRAEDGVEDEKSVARYNRKTTVTMGIVRQSQSNVVEVADGIKGKLLESRPFLPEGVDYFVAYDESLFVKKSIAEVWETLAIAFGLVIVTIFVFLRNVRSTLIPSITIPIAITATFGLLYLLGFSINIVTMLALVLTIGVVVDDSIIVLENIYRHIEEGHPPMEAAVLGMKEITFAVIATTISLAVVFFPLALQTSQTGRLFIEFAFALSGSVIISSTIALTLTPMLCARILRPVQNQKHGSLFHFFERIFQHLAQTYGRVLGWAIRHRALIVFFFLCAVGLTCFFYSQLEKDFLPTEDKSRLIARVLAPEGATSEYTDRMMKKIEDIASDIPEIDGFISFAALSRGAPGAGNQGFFIMRLHDRAERVRSAQEIVDGPNGLRRRFSSEVEGALVVPIVPKAIGRGFGQPFQLVLQGPDLEGLSSFSEQVLQRFREEGFLNTPRLNFEINRPEVRVRIDRNRAGDLKVNVEDISRTMQILFGGLDLSTIQRNGKEYDVIVQLDRSSRLHPEDINRLYVRSTNGNLVQLANVVTLEKGAGPNAIYRFNRARSITLEGTPNGLPLGSAMDRAETLLAEMLPAGYRYEWAGESSDLREAGADLFFVLALALVIVYMVLAAQFESLLHPFTILFTVPLAALGAFGALYLMDSLNDLGTWLAGMVRIAPEPPTWAQIGAALIPRVQAMNLNLFSQIGLVLLVALVTKSGILLVEFANQLRERGLPAREAIIQAGLIRLRPILMTSFSTIAGILPIAIGFGAGAESRRPLGIVAVGGLLTSTVLTLVIVPVFYLLLDRWRKKDLPTEIGIAEENKK